MPSSLAMSSTCSVSPSGRSSLREMPGGVRTGLHELLLAFSLTPCPHHPPSSIDPSNSYLPQSCSGLRYGILRALRGLLCPKCVFQNVLIVHAVEQLVFNAVFMLDRTPAFFPLLARMRRRSLVSLCSAALGGGQA